MRLTGAHHPNGVAPAPSRRRGRQCEAFTMVEIALSLGVIGFALVAILGVLPTGFEVQKDNREETIINQDGNILIEAIRSGALGMDYLTNHFRWIRIVSPSQGEQVFSNFVSGQEIIGLLSRPTFELNQNQVAYGYDDLLPVSVTARVRAITGAAALKGDSLDAADFDLNYLLSVQVLPKFMFTPQQIFNDPRGITQDEFNQRDAAARENQNVVVNFFDLRLQFDWPLYQQGSSSGQDVLLGPNSKSFRALIAGRTAQYQNANNQSRFRYLPNEFVQVNPGGNTTSP